MLTRAQDGQFRGEMAMGAVPSYFRLSILAGILLLCAPMLAEAGWMGFKNETNMTLVIQEQFGTGNSIRYGKPQKIFPNETVRDFPPPGGQRKFVIFDAAKPDKPIFTGSLDCPSARENFLFALSSDGKGSLSTEISKSPAGSSFSSPKKDPPGKSDPPKRKP